MAVTLISQPTYPNVAGTKLLYEVSGSITTGNPQYSYVMDIYLQGGSQLLARHLQRPGPDNNAVFNPATVLEGYLQYDNFWKTTEGKYPISSSRIFDLRFGEAYGTSTSSSLDIFPGITNYPLQVFQGTKNPNDSQGGYNFYTASYTSIPVQKSQYLTNQPTYEKVNFFYTDAGFHSSNDYLTATNFQDSNESITVRGNLDFGKYNKTTAPSSNNYSGYIVTQSVLAVTASVDYPNARFVTWPIGPQNLKDSNDGWKQLIESGSINNIETTSDNGRIFYYIRDKVYNNYVSKEPTTTEDIFRVPKDGDHVEFAFINKYGFYDYYTVWNPLRRVSSLERNNVSLPKVDYSGTVSTYSIENGGEQSYYIDKTDSYSITTDYLDDSTANWLEELLESPEVYIRQDKDFVPIIITNTSYTENNNESRNKLFQYTITFTPSNGNDLQEENVQGIEKKLTELSSYVQTTVPLIELDLRPKLVNTYGPEWRFNLPNQNILPYTSYEQDLRSTLSALPNDPKETDTSKFFNYTAVPTGEEFLNIFTPGPTAFFGIISDIEVYSDGTKIYETAVSGPIDGTGTSLPFSASFTDLCPTEIIISQSVQGTGSFQSQSFTTNVRSFVCELNEYGPSTPNDIICDLQNSTIPQFNFTGLATSGSFTGVGQDSQYVFYSPFDDFEIGTQLRNIYLVKMSGSGYFGHNLKFQPTSDTVDRLNWEKGIRWNVWSGSIIQLDDDGIISSSTDVTSITPSCTLPYINYNTSSVDWYGGGGTPGFMKGTQDWDGDSTTTTGRRFKGSYNDNAQRGRYSSIWFERGTGNNRSAQSFEPSSQSRFDAYFKGVPQNSPQATEYRTVTVQSQGVCNDFPYIAQINLQGGAGGTSDAPYVNYLWRGYQLPVKVRTDNNGSGDMPLISGSYQEMASYSGSFTGTVYCSNTLQPGSRLFTYPAAGTVGYGNFGGTTNDGGPINVPPGPNDYFPILIRDKVCAFRYNYSTGNVIDILDSAGNSVVGNPAERWRGPYYWLTTGYLTLAGAQGAAFVDINRPKFISGPSGEIRQYDTVAVNDIVYDNYNQDTGVFSNPNVGGDRYFRYHDYNPDWGNQSSTSALATKIIQIDNNGVILSINNV